MNHREFLLITTWILFTRLASYEHNPLASFLFFLFSASITLICQGNWWEDLVPTPKTSRCRGNPSPKNCFASSSYQWISSEDVKFAEWACCIYLKPSANATAMEMVIAGEGAYFFSFYIWWETYTAFLDTRSIESINLVQSIFENIWGIRNMK